MVMMMVSKASMEVVVLCSSWKDLLGVIPPCVKYPRSTIMHLNTKSLAYYNWLCTLITYHSAWTLAISPFVIPNMSLKPTSIHRHRFTLLVATFYWFCLRLEISPRITNSVPQQSVIYLNKNLMYIFSFDVILTLKEIGNFANIFLLVNSVWMSDIPFVQQFFASSHS